MPPRPTSQPNRDFASDTSKDGRDVPSREAFMFDTGFSEGAATVGEQIAHGGWDRYTAPSGGDNSEFTWPDDIEVTGTR